MKNTNKIHTSLSGERVICLFVIKKKTIIQKEYARKSERKKNSTNQISQKSRKNTTTKMVKNEREKYTYTLYIYA